jgi:hypothetical protein
VGNEDWEELLEMLRSKYGFPEFSELIHAKVGWSQLKKHLRDLSPLDITTSLGLDELYCSWLDIDEVLASIEEWMSFPLGVQAAQHRAVELIESMLLKGHSTSDLDIDALIPTPGIRLVPLILECRKREVESAKIYYTSAGNRINVRDLKRTYYGMKLMRELPFVRFTRRVSQEDFKSIKNAMAEIGLRIQEPQCKS